MHASKAIATAIILCCEMAYVVPNIVCDSSNQPLCGHHKYKLFRKPLEYRTITWNSKNEHNYVGLTDAAIAKCTAPQSDDSNGHSHGP
ncbi:hypothetical protein KEM48_008652 [Puccinia striiformis f. sp. tritici PST-130]|nr:hypothetical protein KEM48_008652 [Puccinia striiformis f. sp. tritici PST-130]